MSTRTVRDRFVPPLLFGMVVSVLWWVFHTGHGLSRSDRWVLLYVGSIYAYAALCMVIGTRVWSLRGLGLLGTLIAAAGIYIGIARPAFGWRGLQNWELDLIRSFLVSGGTFLAVGLTVWLFKTRAGTKLPDPTPPDAVPVPVTRG